MSDTINVRKQTGIDKAFQYAVTLAWGEFTGAKPRSIRVEYLCEAGTALNHLTVWSVRAGGYQDLVCAYEAPTSSGIQSGMRFANQPCSEGLTQTLNFIMQHQNQFSRPADAGRHGLVLVYPPDGDDRIEAAAWMKDLQDLESEISKGGAPGRLRDLRENQNGKASSRQNELVDPSEGSATVSDATGYSGREPVEALAKTSPADYFELRYAWPE
jgi:hypothetical protein